jgi:hypothetical protein
MLAFRSGGLYFNQEDRFLKQPMCFVNLDSEPWSGIPEGLTLRQATASHCCCFARGYASLLT